MSDLPFYFDLGIFTAKVCIILLSIGVLSGSLCYCIERSKYLMALAWRLSSFAAYKAYRRTGKNVWLWRCRVARNIYKRRCKTNEE